ncbi:MAG: VOC family protein [Meiothermus sp.]|nr:VOC family protein [Meiothermus sp.]
MEATLLSKSAQQMHYQNSLTLAVNVSDFEAAKRWYGEVLGLEFVYEITEIAWAEFKTPVAGMTLGVSGVETVNAGGSIVPTWGVSDIEQARAHLEAHRVRFDGPTQTVAGMVKLATFYDPDGNPFMLAETLPAQQ